MQTASTTNELVMLNPYTINTNTFVVSEGSVGDTTATVWTFVNGDATGPDATHLAPTLYPAAGRWVKNAGGSGGTNIFNTIIVTNLTVISNLTADTLWTNKAGVLQPTDLTLPVMLTNQLSFSEGRTNTLAATNGANLAYFGPAILGQNTMIAVYRGANPVYFGSTPAGGAIVQSPSNRAILDVNNSQAFWDGTNFEPTGIGALGTDIAPWTNSWFSGTTRYEGFWDATGTNYLRLEQSISGTTSVLDLVAKTNNVNAPITGFSFRTNGVEVGWFGGSSNSFVRLAGDTMTGALRVPNGVTADKFFQSNTITNISAVNEVFADISAWGAAGGGTWSCDGSALYATNTGSLGYGNWLYYTNWFSSANNYRIEADVVPLRVDANCYGIGLGVRNGNADNPNDWFAHLYCASAPNNGWMTFEYNTTEIVNAYRKLAVSVNDQLHFVIVVKDDWLSFSVTNSTTGGFEKLEFSISAVNASQGGFGSSGYFGISNVGGDYKIDNFKVWIVAPTPCEWLIIGDSITRGQAADPFYNCWRRLVSSKLNGNVTELGRGGDTTAISLASVPEVLAISPKNIITMIGGNDLLFGVTTNVWMPAYTNWISQISSNSSVIQCLPTARTPTYMHELANFIVDTYGWSNVIDTFTTTRTDGGTNETLRAAYDSGDGVHPNNSGHAAIANTIFRFLDGKSNTNLFRWQ